MIVSHVYMLDVTEDGQFEYMCVISYIMFQHAR